MISHFGSNIRKIWIEKIGPLKLFVVLVPGLLCNFGWEVTIKIHYSTVWGGVAPIYIYRYYIVNTHVKKKAVSPSSHVSQVLIILGIPTRRGILQASTWHSGPGRYLLRWGSHSSASLLDTSGDGYGGGAWD